MTLVEQFGTVRARTVLADAALALTILAIVGIFTVSSALLGNAGYHYGVPGGFPWEKIHPATFAAAGALGLRVMSARDPRGTAARVAGDPAIVLFVVAITITAAHGVFVTASPVTQLIDSFLLPAMLFCLLRDLAPDLKAKIAYGVCLLMALNAAIGLLEYPTAWRLVPTYLPENNAFGIKPDGGPILASSVDWRGTALLGHPLINALASGACVVALAGRGAAWLHPLARYASIALLMLSQAAFGGRASLVLAVLFLGLSGGVAAFRFVRDGRRLPPRAIGVALLLVPIALAAALVAVEAGVFDQVVSRFESDNGSAQARIVMWQMFDVLSWRDILLGPDPEIVSLNQYLLGLEQGIESFWVALTLTYGVIVAGILFCGLGLFVWTLIRTQGRGAAAVLGYTLLVASTSTSLSSKSVMLALITVMTMTLLRREDEDAR